MDVNQFDTVRSASQQKASQWSASQASEANELSTNELRLGPWEWLTTLAIVAVVAVVVPRQWAAQERLPDDADYRIPYALSKDYWLYQQRLERIDDRQIPILGDSVVWGEYVLPDGTLSHFLNSQPGCSGRFVNCGLNGLFPLAMEGLVEHYAAALERRKVIVHCNLLWMTSPQADLSTPSEQSFNHSRLVAQFSPRIPCYRADAVERLSAMLENRVPFFAWLNHLQNAYYDQKNIPQWTLTEDASDPPRLMNAWRSPLEPLFKGLPGEPNPDPQRGPKSPRHKPWNTGTAEPAAFDWVEPEKSLQWQAFQRLIHRLQKRDNDILVVIGPFNEHMIVGEQKPTFRAWRDTIVDWLAEQKIAVAVPAALPSELYADASHPLTAGYRLLASRLTADPAFGLWLGRPAP